MTRNEMAAYKESLTRRDELGTARKERLSGSKDEIPNEMWVLLLGGGVLMLTFTYLLGTSDVVVHATLIGLVAALMGFVLFLIFELEHPFVGSLSVPSTAYEEVLESAVNPATRPH